ncbi:MAG: N-acetylmuramoyl-L-alanine amidase [Polyangia bacterium]|jgi:N-acetylmuramoyl-L-alanine amidase|nr:N-acetylmuramoyl-L-alanine amidase [Polyangia bacterium]
MSHPPTVALVIALGCLTTCAEPPPAVPSGACKSVLDAALGERDRLLAGGIRSLSRSSLDALARSLRTAAERCGRSEEGTKALTARAELHDAAARATGAPEDVEAALVAWADLDDPKAPVSAEALWRRADLALSFDLRREAFTLLERLAERHPGSPQATRARQALALLGPLRPDPAPPRRPPGPAPEESPLRGHAVDPDSLGLSFRASPERPARLTSVMRWSTPSFTRLVAVFDEPVRYLHGLLGKDEARPARIYLDFPATVLGDQVERAQAVEGHLVRGLRLASRPPSGARLVADLAEPVRFDIYPLQHPYRVVIDLWRVDGGKADARAERPAIRVVALDPGHGGPENGAVGREGTKEKDVTLAVARHAAEGLRKAGLKVVLTRDGDQGLSLEERSALALTVGADLFVSIHANAEPTGKHAGVETYFLDVASDKYAARLADRENRAAEGRPVSHYRLMLADLTTRATTVRSGRLARAVQAQLLGHARRRRPGLPDRGVRPAIFYVLLTARMPGILTEISFLTNPEGEAALKDPAYLELLGRGIAQGVLEYARTVARAQPGTK